MGAQPSESLCFCLHGGLFAIIAPHGSSFRDVIRNRRFSNAPWTSSKHGLNTHRTRSQHQRKMITLATLKRVNCSVCRSSVADPNLAISSSRVSSTCLQQQILLWNNPDLTHQCPSNIKRVRRNCCANMAVTPKYTVPTL
jgi:hypothetical protein